MSQLHKTGLAIVGAIAITAAASMAQAADLRPMPVKAPPVAVIPIWAGFYVGGHVGGAWSDWDTNTTFIARQPGTGLSNTATFPGPNGTETHFIGGGQIGYNWQYDRAIFGLLATFSGLTSGDDERFNIPASALIAAGVGAITSPVNGFVSTWERQVEWLATFRAQLGYLVTPGAMLFVSGGGALGSVDVNVSYTGLVANGPGTTTVIRSSHNSWDQWGWTIGGGGEMILGDTPWRLRAEYLYVDLGSVDHGLGTYIQSACCTQTGSFDSKVRLHIATIGLNYRF